jgi:hypothetical protein
MAVRAAALLSCLVALAGCQSSAKYTVPSAAINSVLAASVSVAQKTAGGCYSQCVGGTMCNPRTGFCESPGVVCIGSEAESPACLNRPGTTMDTSAAGPAVQPARDLPFGISPATGSVPPPPGTRPQ